MTRIKFCGITRPADALRASTFGASYAGVIFAESRRKVTIERAREIFASAGELRRVGVFGTGTPNEILRTARAADLDIIQLHGGVSPDELVRLRDGFDGELWAVIGLETSNSELPPNWPQLADVADALLVDSVVKGKSGGTGRSFDWKAASASVIRAARQIPIVVAGGLTPENVEDAIAALSPAVVDVSSGVESAPGVKDPDRMNAFAEAVRSASIV